MKSLCTEEISIQFGAVEVLKELSLDFYPGTITALVGDNGAGKSTFLKVLAGVHKPGRGRVIFNDSEISDYSANVRRQLGIEMVYQDLALARRQNVTANLFMGREKLMLGGLLNTAQMKLEAASMLERLGIRIPDLNKAVRLLSGGQQQAIAIARALMFDPKVLLLDEPTAALAAREVEKTLELIQQQKSAGRIVILVSHRLNDVLAVADRIVVLKHGKIFSDDPARLLNLASVVEKIVS